MSTVHQLEDAATAGSSLICARCGTIVRPEEALSVDLRMTTRPLAAWSTRPVEVIAAALTPLCPRCAATVVPTDGQMLVDL